MFSLSLDLDLHKSLFTDHEIVIHLYKFVSYDLGHNLQKGTDWNVSTGYVMFVGPK